MTQRSSIAVVLAALVGATTAIAQTNLPPGRTGGEGSNQAAGPSGQHPGQVGEIGGAGPHPGPASGTPEAAPDDAGRAPKTEGRPPLPVEDH